MDRSESSHHPASAGSRRTLLLTSAAALGATTMPSRLFAEASAPRGALAQSRQGMVTSPHELASEAGREVLRGGGNAIEAAIAVNATLCVTYPHFCGLGGDAFMIVSDRNGASFILSGIGQDLRSPPRPPSIPGSKPSPTASGPGAGGNPGRGCSSARSPMRQRAFP